MVNLLVLRIDGQQESHAVPEHTMHADIRRLIGCDTLDIVSLRDGRVMYVDDVGMVDGKPVNPEATRLYHSICRPGATHPICGDVALWLKNGGDQ